MKPNIYHQGKVAIVDKANIDTDQIIPKQFLTSVSRQGFDRALFYDWRYLANGELNPNFPLNQSKYRGASILVAGDNFGCGSSREHAPWALQQFGFEVIIAPSFADIFYNNCVNNGILLIKASPDNIQRLSQRDSSSEVALNAQIDLEAQTLLIDCLPVINFQLSGLVKRRLLAGLDFIGVAEAQMDAILAYENRLKHSRTSDCYSP